jgi:hypothetical protein
MKACETQDDCRNGYECRTAKLMQMHGGEPVPEPGKTVGDNPAPFCAQEP